MLVERIEIAFVEFRRSGMLKKRFLPKRKFRGDTKLGDRLLFLF
jgi:hypothetical protein